MVNACRKRSDPYLTTEQCNNLQLPLRGACGGGSFPGTARGLLLLCFVCWQHGHGGSQHVSPSLPQRSQLGLWGCSLSSMPSPMGTVTSTWSGITHSPGDISCRGPAWHVPWWGLGHCCLCCSWPQGLPSPLCPSCSLGDGTCVVITPLPPSHQPSPPQADGVSKSGCLAS